MALLEFSLFPIGKGERVGKHVARSLASVDRSGLPSQLNPMDSVLEGERDDIFPVVKRCYDRMRRDCPRVALIIKVDHRRGRRGALVKKVASVDTPIGRRLRTA